MLLLFAHALFGERFRGQLTTSHLSRLIVHRQSARSRSALPFSRWMGLSLGKCRVFRVIPAAMWGVFASPRRS